MMIKDILVHLDESPRSDVRLSLAADLAGRHDASLTAVYVLDVPPPALFYGDPSGFIDPVAIENMMDRLRQDASKGALRREEGFRERIRRDGLEGEWRLVEGPAAETVALHAKYADFVIVGQPNPDEVPRGNAADIPVTALLSSGRPVLMVPYAGNFDTVGQTVLVGWKASSEAARAVNDAIPLLKGARSVTVLAVNPERGIAGDGDVPAADIAHHLARHGVKAQAAHTVVEDIPEGDALLNYASDIDADLIVMGGYGHSRAREFAFGGVTRSLLSAMTVPVFMSH